MGLGDPVDCGVCPWVASPMWHGPLVVDSAGALLFVAGLGVDARAWAPEGAEQWGLRWCPYVEEEG